MDVPINQNKFLNQYGSWRSALQILYCYCRWDWYPDDLLPVVLVGDQNKHLSRGPHLILHTLPLQLWCHTTGAGQLLLPEPAKGTLPCMSYSHSSDFSFQYEKSWKKQESSDPPVLQPFAGTEYCGIYFQKDAFFTFCSLQSEKHVLGADEQALLEHPPHKLFPLHALPVGPSSVGTFRSQSITDFSRN